jgi:hypothetical protein
MSGKNYERYPDVEAEIQRVLRLPQSDWISEMKRLQNETLVFLIRNVDRADEDLLIPLLQDLSRRIVFIVRRWCRMLDKFTMEEIAVRVEIEILELVLAQTPSVQSQFLEMAFAKAVESRTIDAIRKHKTSPFGRRGETEADSDNEDDAELEEVDRPLELVEEPGPGPREIFLQREDERHQAELIERAYAAVKDPRHLQAAILHHRDGWPIKSKDPGKADLARFFNAPPGTIKHWIERAMAAMREALGVEK